MTEITPKPCPFCGGLPYFYQIYERGGYVWKVMCGGSDGKRVDCCAILNDWPTQEEAITAWNKRNSPPENASSELFAVVKSYADSNNCVGCRERKQTARNLIENIGKEART